MADLYQLLAVSPGASQDELRAAYRRLLKRHHPDQFPTGTPEHQRASGVTRALVAAWDVVGEPASRRAYDATLVGGRSCVSVPAGAPAGPDREGPRGGGAGHETTAPSGRGTAPAPQQRRVEQRYVEAHGPARLREVRPSAVDPAAELLLRALRQVVAGASGSTGQVAEELYAAALAELAGVRSRATRGTADRSVAAAALTTACRELVARGLRPRPLLEAVAEQALRALGADVPAALLASGTASGAAGATGPGAAARVLRTLMWVAAAVWIVLTSQLLGEPQPTASAWLHDVVTSAALGVAIVGPWWFLARAVPPRPARATSVLARA